MKGVCIKKIRISSKNNQDKIKEVPRVRSLVGLLSLTNPEAVLQGGCCVETPGSSKCYGPQGYHVRPPSTRLGMDARWGAAGVYKEESGHESH